MLSGTGAGIVYATCTATVAKWYPEKRAARVGLVTGAIGCGAVPFIVAFAAALTPTNRTGLFTAVGVIILVVVAQFGALLRDPPAGWWPSDVDPKQWAIDKKLNRGLRNNVTPLRQYSPGEAVRTPAFVVMYLILVIAAAASLLAAVYIPIVALSQGFSLGVGALAVGLLAVVNGTGRSMAGRLSDRYGRRQTLSAALLIEGCAQLGLVYSASIGHPAAFVVFAALSGLAGGAFYPLVASLVADYFGEPSAVRNFGMVYSAKLFGGLIGIGLPALLVASHTADGAIPRRGPAEPVRRGDDANAAPPRPPYRPLAAMMRVELSNRQPRHPKGVPMPTTRRRRKDAPPSRRPTALRGLAGVDPRRHPGDAPNRQRRPHDPQRHPPARDRPRGAGADPRARALCGVGRT